MDNLVYFCDEYNEVFYVDLSNTTVSELIIIKNCFEGINHTAATKIEKMIISKMSTAVTRMDSRNKRRVKTVRRHYMNKNKLEVK